MPSGGRTGPPQGLQKLNKRETRVAAKILGQMLFLLWRPQVERGRQRGGWRRAKLLLPTVLLRTKDACADRNKGLNLDVPLIFNF